MLNGKNTRRNATIAAITAASLSLPMISAVQAHPQASHKAMCGAVQDPLLINRESAKGQPAFQNFTLPEFSPDYTGSNGG